MLLKDLSSKKLKRLSLIFILSHINNSFDHAKIYVTLFVHRNLEELFQLIITIARFVYCTICCHLVVKQ